MTYLLLVTFSYLVLGVAFYAAKRPQYSHFSHTISELGENGSAYEKAVGFGVFVPVGLTFLLLAALNLSNNMPVAVLAGAMGFSYFLSAIFPCDAGTPMAGSWKNTMHNLVGGVAYITIGYQLRELIDLQTGWYANVTFIALAVFLFNFILGWPKAVVGLTQRIAETTVFMCIFMLLLKYDSLM